MYNSPLACPAALLVSSKLHTHAHTLVTYCSTRVHCHLPPDNHTLGKKTFWQTFCACAVNTHTYTALSVCLLSFQPQGIPSDINTFFSSVPVHLFPLHLLLLRWPDLCCHSISLGRFTFSLFLLAVYSWALWLKVKERQSQGSFTSVLYWPTQIVHTVRLWIKRALSLFFRFVSFGKIAVTTPLVKFTRCRTQWENRAPLSSVPSLSGVSPHTVKRRFLW